MARSFLANIKLLKKFWYWALRKANLCMNTLSISQQQNDSDDLSLLSTSYYKFYGVKPDYCILFLFGAIGTFCRICDRNNHHTSFKSQCLLDIALSCSEFTNGMVFYNLILNIFCTSIDYLINKNWHIGETFPSLSYEGGLTTSVLLKREDDPLKFDIGETVYVQDQKM